MTGWPARLATLGLALAIGAPVRSVRAQAAPLDKVLARAGEYVTSFQRQLAGIVSEETYVQDVHEPLAAGPIGRAPAPQQRGPAHRELMSDLLLVKPNKSDRWVQFRDVFEVDGHPIRDRSERLMKLFVDPTTSTASQADQIVTESSRYNIGNILRTINVPVFALVILDPRHQSRFRFERADAGAPAIARDFTVPDGTWVLKYEETAKGTLIATSNGRDLPAHGRFWIDPATGQVLISELVAEDFVLAGTVVVKYQAGLVPDLLVPAAMRERYLERRNNVRIDGAATYAKFRQFQVKVDEKIAPIKEQ